MAEFVLAEYTGRVKDTGEVFDTTDEAVAKQNNIYDPEAVYGPLPVILGDNRVMKGLDKALSGMNDGEEKKIELQPEEAFGVRDSKLVKLVPISIFTKNNVTPHPGMIVMLEDKIPARVRFVSGGRVSVDLNHELAGKILVYDLKLVKKLKSEEEKIKALFQLTFPAVKPEVKVNKEESELEVVLPKGTKGIPDLEERKAILSENIKRYLKSEKLKISEEH